MSQSANTINHIYFFWVAITIEVAAGFVAIITEGGTICEIVDPELVAGMP